MGTIKKIPWIAWQNLCKEKENGGLGFHDLKKFNQSLLAKQAWRLWNSPNSLVARILKARYFPRSSFLEGCVGRRPSYAWKNILHGRELMQKGLLKEIGNGEESRLWIDNWIMDKVPRPPIYRQDAMVDLTLNVSDLIDHQHGGWNLHRVREVIADEDINRVLATKICRQRQDSLK